MRINPIKHKILEEMAKDEKPKTPKDIAKVVGLNFSSCMMHLLGLKKAGYISSPDKGHYKITNLGKEILKPGIGREEALFLLSPVAQEKAFHFYIGMNQPTGMHANSLRDFSEKLKHLDIRSIEFHISRKDFEAWVGSLGDHELARTIEEIRGKKVSGEKLRRLVHEAVQARCDELVDLSKPSER
jgi:predicted transcriptional regulator